RRSWRPPPAFFSALLKGLGAAPWLHVVPVHELADTVPPGPDAAARTLAPHRPALIGQELPASYLARIARARSHLTSFLSTVGPGYAAVEDFSRDLYVAESSAYRRF